MWGRVGWALERRATITTVKRPSLSINRTMPRQAQHIFISSAGKHRLYRGVKYWNYKHIPASNSWRLSSIGTGSAQRVEAVLSDRQPGAWMANRARWGVRTAAHCVWLSALVRIFPRGAQRNRTARSVWSAWSLLPLWVAW